MKRVSAVVVLLVMLMSIGVPAAAEDPSYVLRPVTYKVMVDGRLYTDPDLPVLTLELNGGNNTYVPLRRFAEIMGLEVAWDKSTGSAIIREAGQPKPSPLDAEAPTPPADLQHEYVLHPVAYRVIVLGRIYTDPELPILTLNLNGGNNTYVPLRRFASQMRRSVRWDQATGTAAISRDGTLPRAGSTDAGARIISSPGPDSDHDGLPDFEEVHKYGTDPNRADTAGAGKPDGDWSQRRAFTYSILSHLSLKKPYFTAIPSTEYQDVRVLHEDDESLDVEVVSYPLNTNSSAVQANPRWRQDDLALSDYVKPGIVTNWDANMRAELLRQLKTAGIDPETLSDKEVVEKTGRWIKGVEGWADMDATYDAYELWVEYQNGVPTVLPERKDSFPTGGRFKTPEDAFGYFVLGKEMFANKVHGGSLSKATYDATIFKALGIPTRYAMMVQVAVGQKSLPLFAGLTNNRLREDWKQAIWSGSGLEFYLELFVGGRWVLYKNGVLGANIFDKSRRGLYIQAGTFKDPSDLPLARTWGLLLYPSNSSNPYTLLELSDHYGAHSKIDNPPVPSSDLSTVTVTKAAHANDPALSEWIRRHLRPSDMVLLIQDMQFTESFYAQMDLFAARAGSTFTLKADGHPDVLATGVKATVSDQGVGGYVIQIPDTEWNKVQKGVVYHVIPVNTSDTYRWVVPDSITVTWP